MKGMANTPFALLAVTLLMMLYMAPLGSVQENLEQNVLRSESANMQAHNLENGFRKGLGITASNYVNASNHYVVDNGFVADAEASVDLDSGEFDGVKMNYTDYSEWTNQLQSTYYNRGDTINYNYSDRSLSPGLKIDSEAQVDYNFTESSSSTTYSVDRSMQGATGVTGPDPLLADASEGAFAPHYRYCGFEAPATRLGTGNQSSNQVAHGYATVQLENSEGNKIFVTENASKYTSAELSSFNGVISEASGKVPSGDYASVSEINTTSIDEGKSIIINQAEVWNSHFRKIIDHNCYVSNSNAPGIYNRMEGNFLSSSKGVTTFVGDQSNSTNVNEAYMFYKGDDAPISSIKGVTTGDHLDTRSWFRLSDQNIVEWNIGSLAE